MNRQKWEQMEYVLDRFGVKPLVGIIPSNADKDTMPDAEDNHFWNMAQGWLSKGWCVALHGYDHVCISDAGMSGINPMWKRSEFAGVALEIQRKKIREGLSILQNHDIYPNCFFAPSHTFDENTLVALEEESDIRIISDTIAFNPYKRGNFLFIPQIVGHCVKMPISGTYTFCFHPNNMNEADFGALTAFLERNSKDFIPFSEVTSEGTTPMTIADKILKKVFFTYRKLRGLQ